MTDRTVLSLPKYVNHEMAVSAILARKAQDVGSKAGLILPWQGDVAHGVAGDSQRLSDAPLQVPQSLGSVY